MSTGNVNKKSAQLAARVPHDVIEEMEIVKRENESTANFIVTSMRGEIARRQVKNNPENALISSLDALARIDEIGSKVKEELDCLICIVQTELQQRGVTPKT